MSNQDHLKNAEWFREVARKRELYIDRMRNLNTSNCMHACFQSHLNHARIQGKPLAASTGV